MSERRYRHDFALLHPLRSELLGWEQGGVCVLPSVASDDWLETSEVLGKLRSSFSLEAVMLRPAGQWREAQLTTMLYVLVAQTETLPSGARWLDLEALRAGALNHPEQHVLETILLEDAEPERAPALRPAWAKRSWLGEVKSWLARELARLKREPRGEPEQVKHWSLSAVLRQQTDSGAVYFKAPMNHFVAEPRITAAVAELFPELTPQVLALEPSRGWLLLEAFEGSELGEAALELRCEALRRFSTLQVASAAHRPALLAAGCGDRGLATLEGAVPQLLRGSLELARLSSEERKRLLVLEPVLLEKIAALAACGLPETLVHGDLHFGNIAHQAGRFIIFDWTDGCFSHPFFDLTLQKSPDRTPEVWGALRDAYLSPWLTHYDEAAVWRALELAEQLGPLFYAQSYEGIQRAQEPAARGDFSGVVANYLRQLL